MKMATLEGSRKTVEDALIKAFKNSIQDEVLGVGDPGYDQARVIYNGMFDIKPALIVRPVSVEDVINTVNFARDNNILLAVKGGGTALQASASAKAVLQLT